MTMMRGFPRLKKLGHPAAPTPQAATATVTQSADVIEPTPEVPVSQISTAPSPAPYDAEFDEDGRLLITTPLAPPPRPVPTVLNPTPACRIARPVLPPGGGLMASRLARLAADGMPMTTAPRKPAAPVATPGAAPSVAKPLSQPLPRPVFRPPAPAVKSDASAASTRPPAPSPRVPMTDDAGKFQLRPPATKPPQVTARTPKWPVLTADDIPF
jgi:hypothetical protein